MAPPASAVLRPSLFEEKDQVTNLPSWSLITQNYHQRFVLPFEFKTQLVSLSIGQAFVASKTHSAEAKASADGHATGATVWDAGVVLAEYILTDEHRKTKDCKSCLDLGSGTGIVGLAAAASGKFTRVLLTDLPSVTPLLNENLHRNSSAVKNAEVQVQPLRWNNDSDVRDVLAMGPFDVILGGDILYRPQLVDPLLHVLCALCGEHTNILISSSLLHSPETMRIFSERAIACGFSGVVLDCSKLRHYPSEEVKLIHLTKCASVRVNMPKSKKRARSWQNQA